MKIYFLSQKSPRSVFRDEKGESSPPLTPSEVASEWSSSEGNQKEGGMLLWAEMFCLVWPWPQVFSEPSRCYFLGSCLSKCAADTVLSFPLPVACKLLTRLTIGLRDQKLTVEDIPVAKNTVVCFPFCVIVQKKELRKGVVVVEGCRVG